HSDTVGLRKLRGDTLRHGFPGRGVRRLVRERSAAATGAEERHREAERGAPEAVAAPRVAAARRGHAGIPGDAEAAVRLNRRFVTGGAPVSPVGRAPTALASE